ncbi:MAG: hypothetical protein WC926_03275 [Candidatus Paceibacterota bacterium]|jgi:hypothetical protein
MNFSRKKTIVALFSVAFALVVAGPASAACTQADNFAGCSLEELQTLLAQLTTATTQTPAATATGNVPAACAGITFTRNLTVGSTGADVKCLQAFFNQSADTQVAATGVGSVGNETTYFGAKTKTAAMAFQTKYGITPVAGFVGSITRAKLNELLVSGTPVTGTYPAGCTSSVGYSPTTGLPCSSATLPAGCTSSVGYSPTTGLPCSGTVTPVTPVGNPLTVALASDTPVGGNVMAGEANKVVTKLTFTAGADADATINTLKIKSYGTAADADVTNIKIYVDGIQIGNTYSQLSAGTAFFTFVPGITVTKGTSKTVDVVATILSGTTNYSAAVRLGVEAATSIGGTSFTGTYPVVGNSFTIVYGANIGTVTVAKTGTVPVTSVGAGATDVVLGNVRISANSTEDIKVSQIVITASSTAAAIYDGDVVNIRANVGGVTQGTVTGFSNRKATINFATPITITKGGSVVVQILGDVVLGVGREIKILVAAGSVSATGVTSGVGIANTAASTADSTISITAGRLTLSTSTASPSGTSAQYVKSSSLQTLGAFNVKATGEQVLVTKIYAGIEETTGTTTAGTISSVGIYLNDSLISQTYDIAAADWDDSESIKTFDISVTIDANTTATFYVKGITSGITAPTTAPIHVVLTGAQTENSGYTLVGTGLTSSGQQGQSSDNVKSNTPLTLPTITIYGGASASVAANTSATPQNQSVLTGAAQVLVGTVKVTAQREDQTLSQLILTGVPSGSTTAQLFSGVALFDGDTQVTDFVAPSTNTVTFTTNDILSPGVTFVKGTAKTLKIVGNTLSGAGIDGDTVYFKVLTSGITTVGNDSSENASAPTSDTNLTFSDGTYNHGTYTFNDIVVTAAKNAASPSGTVGRGTFKTYAIWDLQSYGTNDDITIGTTTLTSNSGIPSGLSTTTDLGMFRLVDADDSSALALAASDFSVTNGTVTFVPTANNTITAGTTKRIALLITTNDTTTGKWVANTGMLWTIGDSTAISLSAGGLGSGDGINFSIPADTNAVSIGS